MTTRDEEKSCKIIKDWKAFKSNIMDAEQERAYLAELGIEDEGEEPDPAAEAEVIAIVDTILEDIDHHVSGKKSDELGSDVDDEDTRNHRRNLLDLIRNLRLK